MAKRRQSPREFAPISKPLPHIDALEFSEFHTLYLRAIFASLQRRGLITTEQRNAALTEIDRIPRKPG
ncbi:MAG: hypothetical protein FWE19_05660 [Oscillospiraceae bacterium]|nr:hypothetical protein [Oscillospiraceae bacterium]